MTHTKPDTRIAIVGSGFSGLGLAIRLKQAGMHDFVILERAEDLGGTWRDNSYPGCRCDVPSHLYSFSFAMNPDWSETYSPQPEIWEYLRRVSAEHGLERHIRYGHDVQASQWDDDAQMWRLKSSGGELTAQFVALGAGALADPRIPDLPGLDDFQGEVFHSASWNHDYDLRGKRVAVVGTGASAVQFIPEIQPDVERLVLFQRTPSWVLPHTNRGITRAEKWLYRTIPGAQRLSRLGIYLGRELMVFGLAYRPGLLKPLEVLSRAHLNRQVRDPKLRAKLTPNFRLGCKRILLSNDYYLALTRPNVDVVPAAITAVKPRSVVGADGSEHEVDAIILGTGFHVTDPPYAEHIQGRDGRTLAEAFAGSPRAYLGTTSANFPNAFTLLGPNTGLGHTSVVYMIEGQINYVMRCLREAWRHGWRAVEVRPSVERAYNDELQRKLLGTVWNSGGCASWYLDGNGRNSTIWPRFTWQFRLRTRSFRPSEYAVTPER
ncbi:MAG: NAD(P)-binding protein [Micromonosporaceae bacterium]|nr:NAD(P)-binding protein [Micromonosporaceae bacterium]